MSFRSRIDDDVSIESKKQFPEMRDRSLDHFIETVVFDAENGRLARHETKIDGKFLPSRFK
jgi:hypothetical protein